MKQLILMAALCCGLFPVYAQHKKLPTINDIDNPPPGQLKPKGNKPSAINEIDRLYKKYKGIDSMLITNVNGSFYAHISVEFNAEGKPQSITLEGESTNIEAVKLFIEDLKKDRQSKGYEEQSPYGSDGDTYVKGSLYTRFSEHAFGTDAPIWERSLKGHEPIIWFTIENGDVKRMAGSKATKVDF